MQIMNYVDKVETVIEGMGIRERKRDKKKKKHDKMLFFLTVK
jgi:hypothetical protein